jgi:hypothetical protein
MQKEACIIPAFSAVAFSEPIAADLFCCAKVHADI